MCLPGVRTSGSTTHRRRRQADRGQRPRARLHIQPLAQKSAHVLQRSRSRHRRQAVEKRPTIALAKQSWVAEHYHAEILLVADQPTDSLLERHHRLRYLFVEEWVAALRTYRIEPGLEQRIVGDREWQLVDDHYAKRVAPDVDAFPETARAKQYRVARIAEGTQKPVARRLALHEDGHRGIAAQSSPQLERAFAQSAMTGEEQKGAPATRLDHRHHRADHLARILLAARIAEPFGQVEQRLVPEIEGALESQGAGACESRTPLVMREVLPHRERSRGQHPGAGLGGHQRAQFLRDVDRRVMAGEMPRAGFHPANGARCFDCRELTQPCRAFLEPRDESRDSRTTITRERR